MARSDNPHGSPEMIEIIRNRFEYAPTLTPSIQAANGWYVVTLQPVRSRHEAEKILDAVLSLQSDLAELLWWASESETEPPPRTLADLRESIRDEVLPRFGHGVRAKREARGWSQLELAERADTAQTWISRIERGLVDPMLDMVQGIAYALDVLISELLKEEGVIRTLDGTPTEFSDRLRMIRKDRGLTVYQVGAAMGFHPTNLSHYESSDRPGPRLSTLVTLARALRCSVDDLALPAERGE